MGYEESTEGEYRLNFEEGNPVNGENGLGNHRFVIDHSVSQELCVGRCSHSLAGVLVQLNRCNFYRELYLGREVDGCADNLYNGGPQI